MKVDISEVGREYLRALGEQQQPPTPLRATLNQADQQTWDWLYEQMHGVLCQRVLREPDLVAKLAGHDQLERTAVAMADAAVREMLAHG
ncbi:MAG: hypothetical protein ACOYBP_09035 [Microbacteriaceae bacterium]